MSKSAAGFAIAVILAIVGVAFSPAAFAQVAASPRIHTTSGGLPCVPTVEGPIAVAAASQPYMPSLLPALPVGWVDQEFFLSCASAQITYRTSVDVRRPANARRASGITVVEPLHSGGIFGVLTNCQPYLVAHGDVHIGVAANSDVVQRLVKSADPGRYATLDVPTSSEAENDILAGVGAVLHEQHDALLPGIRVTDAVLGGWSQTSVQVRDFIASSGGRATVNGRRVYDGYFPAQPAVGTGGGAELGPIPDVGVPVVELQGERELLVTLQIYGSVGYRRPDSATYRLYEVPGMSHINYEPDDPVSAYARSLQCDWPPGASPSTFKQTQVWDAALDNLVRWVSRGIPAPHAQRIELESDGKTVIRDANGNALGGLRTVFVDVPTATIVPTSLAPGGVVANPCAYVGYQLDLSQTQLEQLYRSHAGYVASVVADANRLVGERWLLPVSASELIAEAKASSVLESRSTGVAAAIHTAPRGLL
ncbi:MAG TPA: alpha/beta hydrolase domain-containing protein [Acidimicrobiia bacterium]